GEAVSFGVDLAVSRRSLFFEAIGPSCLEGRAQPSVEPVVGWARGTERQHPDRDGGDGRDEPEGHGGSPVIDDFGERVRIRNPEKPRARAPPDPRARLRSDAARIATQLHANGHRAEVYQGMMVSAGSRRAPSSLGSSCPRGIAVTASPEAGP